MELTQEHEGIRRNMKKFIDTEINPHVDDWEKAGVFPAHEVFKKMGKLGYLGIKRYVRLTLTPANNTGNIPMCAIAVLGAASMKPITQAQS